MKSIKKRSLTFRLNLKNGKTIPSQLGKKSKRRISISQYDLDGNKIANFVSVNDAALLTHISVGSICKSHTYSVPVCNFYFVKN